MIADLKTHEAYLAPLYEDATDVLLMGQHGEARISAAQFAETVDLVDAGGVVWGTLARYQTIDLGYVGFAEDPAIQVRRGQLARYAAANGGQVHTHTQVKRPRSWAQRLLGSGDKA